MRKASIEIECRDEEQLETIKMILNSLEDVYVRDGYIHTELNDVDQKGDEQ